MKSKLMLLSTYTNERTSERASARLPALYTHFNKHTSMSKACCRCICIFVEHNIRFAVYIFHFILFSKIIHRINGIMCHIESVHNLILAFIMEYLFIWEMLSNNDDGKHSPHIHTYTSTVWHIDKCKDRSRAAATVIVVASKAAEATANRNSSTNEKYRWCKTDFIEVSIV